MANQTHLPHSFAQGTHLFVHAGFHKTGSSALQYWLETNQAALADRGVFYPKPRYSVADVPGYITSGNGRLLNRYLDPLFWQLHSDSEDFSKQFRNSILPGDGGKILISREDIGARYQQMVPRLIEEVIPDVKLTFVFVIRDIYNVARSLWTQKVKRDVDATDFKEYMTKFRTKATRLHGWTNVLGKENMKIIHYDSAKNNLVGALLSAIGVDPAIGAVGARRVNRSLSDTEAGVLLECSRAHKQPDMAQLLCDHFMENLHDSPATHSPDQAIVSMLEEKFAEHIQWVNETFFDGRDVYGVGGQPRPKRAGDDSVEMNSEQVWREVALVLAKELASRSGEQLTPAQSRERRSRMRAGAAAAVD